MNVLVSLIFIGIILSIYFLSYIVLSQTFYFLRSSYRNMKKYESLNLEKINNKDPPKDLSHFFEGFSVYYINLDRSSNRRDYIENQFKKHNIQHIERVSAVDGQKINNKKYGVYKPDNGLDDVKYKVSGFNVYTKYELACTLSHLLAIQKAYENGDELALICEDDLSLGNLKNSKISNLREIIEKAPKNWNMISLDQSNLICNFFKNKYIDQSKFKCFNTGVYILNRKGMENILKHHNHNDFNLDYKDCKSILLVADVYIFDTAGNAYTYICDLFYQNMSFESHIYNKE